MGSAGGIILFWDYRAITVLESCYGEFSTSAWVEDLSNNLKWTVTSAYGLNSSQRMNFWKGLDDIRSRWGGPWCVGGDWNEVRFSSEKLGCCRTTPDM